MTIKTLYPQTPYKLARISSSKLSIASVVKTPGRVSPLPCGKNVAE